MKPSFSPLVVQPGAGQDLHAFGNTLSVILSGEQTGGALALMLETTPPGGGPPLHVHHNEDELFIVVSGQIEYFTAGQWTRVAPGGVVYLPRGAAHCYRNRGDTLSQHWILTLPSGFERFFAAAAEAFAQPTPPDAQQLKEIHQEHGIELLDGI